jgi:hypothetical protein
MLRWVEKLDHWIDAVSGILTFGFEAPVTEGIWLKASDPDQVLLWLGDPGSYTDPRPYQHATARQLRLYMVACCRQIWSLLDESSRRAVETAERHADGDVTLAELANANLQACLALADIEEDRSDNWATKAAVAAAEPGIMRVSWCCSYSRWSGHKEVNKVEQMTLLRHIIGNPFRPYPAPPNWPTAVILLAEALYQGEDCRHALHDALLEAAHPDLAEHFHEAMHPRGCWVLDLLTGRK